MSDAPPTILRPSRISTEEAARLRAAAWSFVFRCWQEKEKAVEPTPEPDGRDGTKVQGDSADASFIPD
jgi:hypothetical protein